MGGFRVGEDGTHHLAFFPVEQIELVDDWNPIGLRGTGSGSFKAQGVLVPKRRTCAIPAKPRAGCSPVYAFPPAVMTALCIASVGCGLAKAAFDELGKVAGDSLLGILAAALARQMAARALLCEQVGQAWEHALSGDELPRQMIAHLRLAAVHAARTAAEECRVLQDSAGGAGVPVFSPLGRRLRDAQTVTAHALVSPRLHQELGKLIFGVPPGSTQR
jgi:alkylation response protein AidB-like acyl-CoA dehydrogenase